MSEGDQRPNPGSIGYIPPDDDDADVTQNDPATVPITGSYPVDAPPDSYTTEPVAATDPERPIPRREPVRHPEPSVSPLKLEADEENVVAQLLTRRQALLTGKTSASPVTLNDVAPAVPAGAAGFRRALPVSIYLESDEKKVATRDALLEVLEVFGIEVRHGWPEIRGSSFRSFLARTRTSMKSPEVRTRLAKIERAVELQALHKVQAEVDAAQSDAVAKLITALGSTPTAMIQIGSVLLMKIDGEIIVRNLTQLELLHLERNPALLRSPAAALHELQQLNTAAQTEHNVPARAATQP